MIKTTRTFTYSEGETGRGGCSMSFTFEEDKFYPRTIKNYISCLETALREARYVEHKIEEEK